MYQEIEIETLGHGGKVEPFTFNLDNINYYRSFIDKSSKVGEGDKLSTMVFLQGSPKGMIVKCSYEVFKKKIKEVQKDI